MDFPLPLPTRLSKGFLTRLKLEAVSYGPSPLSPNKPESVDGYTVVTPPLSEREAAIEAGAAVTVRRVADLAVSAYLSEGEARAYAQAFAAVPELILALQEALMIINGLADQQAMPDDGWKAGANKINAALSKAGV